MSSAERGLSVYLCFNIRFNFAALWPLENVLTFLSPFFAFISEIIPTADVPVEHYMAYLIQNMRICVAKEKSVGVWTSHDYSHHTVPEALYGIGYTGMLLKLHRKLGWQLSYDLYVTECSAYKCLFKVSALSQCQHFPSQRSLKIRTFPRLALFPKRVSSLPKISALHHLPEMPAEIVMYNQHPSLNPQTLGYLQLRL